MLLSLDERLVGSAAPTLVVAALRVESADLGRTLAAIDAAAAAGAGAIQIDALGTGRHRDQALRTEWYARLRDRARRRGLVPLAAAATAERIALFAALGFPALVTVPEAIDRPALLRAAGGFGRPIVLPTDTTDPTRIARALEAIELGAGTPERRPPVVLLAGADDPAVTPDVAALTTIGARFATWGGWRDARPGHVLAVAAIALGARMIVKPFSDREAAGSTAGVLGPEAFATMVRAVRELDGSIVPRPATARARSTVTRVAR